MNMDDALSERSNKSRTSSYRQIDSQAEEAGPNSEVDLDEEEREEHGERSEQFEQQGETEIRFIDAQVAKHLTPFITRRTEDLDIFRIRLQMEPLIPQNLTDEQLIIYLITAKYNIAAAVTIIRSNYKLRVTLPNLFTSRAIYAQDITDVWNVIRAAPFPKRLHGHQHISYLGLRMKHQPERFEAHFAMKLFLMCADVYHILEGMPCSIIVILDADGASYGYLTSNNYEHLKIAVKYVQESMPYNVEAVHIINSSSVVKGLFRFIRPFLTKEIIRSIFFHKSYHELTHVLPQNALPSELGGTYPGTIDDYQQRFREKFEQMQEFFEMEEEQRAATYFEQNK